MTQRSRFRKHPELFVMLLAGVCVAALLGRLMPTQLVEAQSDSRPGDPYVVDAGRSPIPQPGETFEQPLPAPLLFRLSPIAPDRLPSRHPDSGVGGAEADVDTARVAPRPVVPWDEARDYVGQTIVAEGEIVDTNRIGKLTFLNFHVDWRDRFYLVVFRDAYAGVPGGKPEEHYLHKTIRVTGRVDLHKGRPQLKVYDADQIEVVAEEGTAE